MKMMIRISPFIILPCLFLFSCKKSSDDNTVVPVVPNTTQPVLVKAFYLDTTLAVPYDTLGRDAFFYDSQSRPIRRESFQTYANGDTSDYTIFTYEYNGNDSFANRTTEDYKDYYNGTISHAVTTTDYIFQNGKRVYDSAYGVTQSGAWYNVSKFSYEAGGIVRINAIYHSAQSGTTNDTQVIYQTYSGNDIIHQVDSLTDVYTGGSYHERFENSTVILNAPNPFAKWSNPIRRPYLQDDIGIGSLDAAPEKLLQHQDYSSVSGTNQHQESVDYTYTFRPDGYPSTGVQTQNGNSGQPTIGKFIFIYQ